MSLRTLKVPKDRKVFWSSDYHINHLNILKYDKRPFKDILSMREEIILKHNEKVGPNDYFVYMGDLMFCRDPKDAVNFWNRLNGEKFYVFGNHDRLITQALNVFKPCDLLTVKVEDPKLQPKRKWQDVVCCHYAMKVWNKSHHGAFHLYGHSHGSLPEDPNSLSFDVGIMLHDYYPWSYPEVKAKMAQKEFKPIDHHK